MALMDIVWQAEDSLREKKVESDLKDLLKTMVAFANSVAPGDTAQIGSRVWIFTEVGALGSFAS
jgi:hypothetical protein